jgi:biopolymer transport protein ExbB
MWPILATFFLALCVILDRSVWWLRLQGQGPARQQAQAREALGTGDFPRPGNSPKTPRSLSRQPRRGHDPRQHLDARRHAARCHPPDREIRGPHVGDQHADHPGSSARPVRHRGRHHGLVLICRRRTTRGPPRSPAASPRRSSPPPAGIGIAILCLLPYNFFRKRVSCCAVRSNAGSTTPNCSPSPPRNTATISKPSLPETQTRNQKPD